MEEYQLFLEYFTVPIDQDLQDAVKKGDFSRIKKLVEGGADVNTSYPDLGWTPLMIATSGGNKKIILYLLQVGAKIDAKAIVIPLFYCCTLKGDDGEFLHVEKVST